MPRQWLQDVPSAREIKVLVVCYDLLSKKNYCLASSLFLNLKELMFNNYHQFSKVRQC